MTNQLLLFVLAAVLLPGAALLWVMRADRRRQFIQQRLKAVARVARADDEEPAPRLSLRRTLAKAVPGAVFQLPRKVWARLDPAFAATGHRIRLMHLLVAGPVAASLAMGFTGRFLALNHTLVILLGGVAAAAAPAVLLRLAQSRYSNRFLDVFPDALDLVGRAVRAGLPVSEALGVAGREIADPVGSELRRALDEVQIGVEMIEALHHVADRVRVADFRFLIATLALQQKTGGSLAETLANLSSVIRARKALRLKARALAAEAKASAMVLAALPFVVGGLMYLLNRDLGSVLFADPRGRFMVGVAFLSLVTGLGTMAVIVRRALR
jgi:tight adherence protein B